MIESYQERVRNVFIEHVKAPGTEYVKSCAQCTELAGLSSAYAHAFQCRYDDGRVVIEVQQQPDIIPYIRIKESVRVDGKLVYSYDGLI